MTALLVPTPEIHDGRTDGRFWPGFSVGVCAAVSIGALVATGFLVADRASSLGTFSLGGTVTLVDGNTNSNVPGFDCEGYGAYSDMSPNTTVSVADAAGRQLAEGRLGSSVREGQFCTFFFNVPDVPRGASSYEVAISHRGAVSFPETETESGVHLVLGG